MNAINPRPAIEVSINGQSAGTTADIIKVQISTIAKNLLSKKDEKKTAKEMLDAVLVKDEKYKQVSDSLANAKKGEKAEKERVIRDDMEAKDASNRLDTIKEEVNDLQEDLDAKLLVWYSTTGATTLEIGEEKFQLVRRVRIATKQMSLFRDMEE